MKTKQQIEDELTDIHEDLKGCVGMVDECRDLDVWVIALEWVLDQ